MEQILREMIERMVGRKMVVPRDFVWLSEKVLELIAKGGMPPKAKAAP